MSIYKLSFMLICLINSITYRVKSQCWRSMQFLSWTTTRRGDDVDNMTLKINIGFATVGATFFVAFFFHNAVFMLAHLREVAVLP